MKIPPWVWWFGAAAVTWWLFKKKVQAETAAPAPAPGVSAMPVGTPPACFQCYKDKSDGYKNCMDIPVDDPDSRALRRVCFKQVDAELQRCLRDCGGQAAIHI